jgi:hypothetical protein
MKLGDFFKPKWKHSDPKVRYEAIRELEETYNSKDLVDVILEDPFLDNKRLALKKISQEDTLSTLVNQVQDLAIREKASQKLHDLRVKALLKIKDDSMEPIALEKVSLITHQKSLEDVALRHALVAVRGYCVEKLEHPSALYKFLLKESHDPLAEKVFGTISTNLSPAQLDNLEKKAASKKIRTILKHKRQKQEGALPSEEKVFQAKLQLLCKDLKRLSQKASENGLIGEEAWAQAHIQYENLSRAWEQECKNTSVSPDLQRTFAEQRERFEVLYEKHQSSVEARKRSEAEKALRHSDVSVEDLEDVKQTKEKTSEENAKIIVAALKKLLATPLNDSSSKKWENLKKDWASLSVNKDSFDGMEFENLSETLTERLVQYTASLKKEEQAKLSEMEAILPKLEDMLEKKDLAQIEKPFKEWTYKWKGQDAFSHLEGEDLKKLQKLIQQFEVLQGRFREAQEWLHWSNLKKKQEVYAKLETVSQKIQEDSGELDGKQLFEEVRSLQKEWKSIGPVSWENSRELWDKYRLVLDVIYEKCQEYFEELEEERKANLILKETLCAEVESQAGNAHNRDAVDFIKETQNKWKSIGPVPKENSDIVWERFKKACDDFFEQRRAYLDEQEGEKGPNLEKKVALCEWVEQHKDSTKWKEASALFKKAQEDWKAIGPVPKEQSDSIWERFRTACDYFFAARQAFFENLEAHKEENYAKKVALCEKVEALDSIEGRQETFEVIKQAQADWKAIGPVDKDQMDAIWSRFRKPIDAFFEIHKAQFVEEQQQREENLVKKEELCVQAEELMESQAWRETSEKMKQLQATWKTIGPAPRGKDKAVWQRFLKACDVFFHAMKEHYRKQDAEREQNLRSKEDLCAELEERAGFTLEEGRDGDAFLRSQNWKEVVEVTKELQRRWKSIGPIPRSKSDALWRRFRLACDYVFEANHASEELDLADNLRVKQEICEDAETLAQQVFTDAQMQKIKELQKEWKEAGPILPEDFKVLYARFKKACETVFAGDERFKK